MRKVISIVVGIVLLLCIPYILKFGLWLVEIDNTNFGFPIWLDLGIDIIAGAFAILLAETLFSRKTDRSTASDVFAIIIGFVVGLFIHCVLRYWYIWISVIVIIVSVFIILKVIDYKKNKKNIV